MMSESSQDYRRWGLLWWYPKQAMAKNKPGQTYYSENLLFEDGNLMVFTSRRQARRYANDRYGYILDRHDLRNHPHYWRIPVPVKIKSIVFEK